MAITAPDLDDGASQGSPTGGPLTPSDPWSAGWSPPTRTDVASRHKSARYHQQEGWIPSQGGSRHRADVESAALVKSTVVELSPKPNKLVVHQSKRLEEGKHSGRRRALPLRATRIAITTTAIGLTAAVAAGAYWYYVLFNG